MASKIISANPVVVNLLEAMHSFESV